MTKFVSITDAGGVVRQFDHTLFISARDQPDGVCLVTTRAGMFGTRQSAEEVEAEVQRSAPQQTEVQGQPAGPAGNSQP